MIKTVIKTEDNMVMVFDDKGEQMPGYQGHYEDVKDKIMADAQAGTVFNHWFGTSCELKTVSRESW